MRHALEHLSAGPVGSECSVNTELKAPGREGSRAALWSGCFLAVPGCCAPPAAETKSFTWPGAGWDPTGLKVRGYHLMMGIRRNTQTACCTHILF